MQDQNADTEWNAALRKHGIIPEKKKEVELTEEDIERMVDKAIKEQSGQKDVEDLTLNELDENEDEDWGDERVIEQMRQQRIAEMKAKSCTEKFGDIREISATDYVEQVNNAGPGVWVVLHLYRSGLRLCELINAHIARLSSKFPAVKFLKSISTTCIPNYPDKNLPTIFVYFEGEMKAQFAGPMVFPEDLAQDDLEWMVSRTGALETALKSDPRVQMTSDSNGISVMTRSSRTRKDSESESDDDDY